MPKASALKCYFGCIIDGPLHRFPKWEYPYTERFNQWKSVLSLATQERGNNYIYNSVRICHRHFEEYYKSPSKLLTRNAIPTLNLDSTQNPQINMPLTQSPQMTMPLAEQYLVGDEPASASILSREKCFKKRESSAIKKLTRKLHEMRQKCKMQ
ncbi:uncharacterized protein LOC113499925 isoform X2 [Trichoplusia ni]|uniref:Uncharacterized protein LOC113499925 isoform X2 n=1 Tax=Trichoplusia ni TaxID=7111 RepID=A0A7E5W6Q5_TRINI|nr:uncharacterized protein LOC113499925 isoform X2 [Trichoplusia ni]